MNSKLIIGIDPDSKAHGIAVFKSNHLTDLDCMNLVEIVELMRKLKAASVEVKFIIEDVAARSFIYSRNCKKSKAAHAKVSNSVGKCQQSQIELMRFIEFFGFEIELIKPHRGNWADDEATFKKHTGWKGRSNPDKRSAAYFGWLGTKKN